MNLAVVSSKLTQLGKLIRVKNLRKAEKLAVQLYKANPDNEQVLKACVLVFAKDNQLKKAVYFADKLLAKDPANFGYVANLANWCLKLEKEKRATQYYQSYISSYPGNARAYFQLGLIYKRTYKYKLSVQMFESAISSGFTPLEECYLNLALVHGEFRHEDEAVTCLEQALRINPGHQIARLNLATLFQAGGRKQEAESLYKKILAQAPNFTEALIRLLYSTKTRPDEPGLIEMAQRQLESQSASVLDKEGLNYALGKGYDDLAEYSRAFKFYRLANDLQASRIGNYNPVETAQFVDDSIAMVSAEWVNEIESQTEIEPIFIVGHFRSGSTLVEQILAGHSAVETLGEIDYFMRLYNEQEGLLTSLYADNDANVLLNIASEYQQLTSAMSKLGNRRLTDKRPDNLLLMGLIKRLFPRARFIHTQRNLLDNAISVYFQQLNDLSKYATSLLAFADYDFQCQRLMRHWQAIFGTCIFELRYEDMVNDPEANARELIDFLGLEWESGCLNFEQRKNFVRTASVSQVREKIYTSSVGRGQNYSALFTDEEKEIYF